ncbi:MAG TPA: TonB-dependent receptor, partial [Phaeodactylibacter sp.]|nr:TonB-dependent receptor [Phaeodactylibacter sp.]
YQESTSDILEIMQLDRAHVMGGLWGDIRLGLDYFLNENNTLTTSVFYENGEDRDVINMEYIDYIGNLENLIGISTRDDHTTKKENNLEYSLTFTHTFEKKGHDLVADIRFQNNETKDASDLLGKYFTPDRQPSGVKDLLQRSGGLEGERRLITQLDYTHSISKNEKWELGYQGSFRNIKNDFLVEEFDDVAWQVLENISNDFKYGETIIGFYGTYKNKIKKFSYQIGARAEHTDITTELLKTHETNPRKYTNFFPSAKIGYDLPNENSIKLSYSRRVRRPRFNDLNPFFTYNDPRNLFQGNPNLNPEFSDTYELGHVKYWDKGSLSSSIFYRHRTDAIKRILQPVNGDTTLFRPENLVSLDDIGLDITASYRPISWWSWSTNVVAYQVSNDASNINQVFQNKGYTWRGRISTKIKFKKQNQFQIKLNHRGKKLLAQGTVFPYTYIDLGFSRHFWNKKGKLTFNISDILNSRSSKLINNTPLIYREVEFLWSRRTAKLTFNYKI